MPQDAGPTYRIPRRGAMDPATRRLAIIAGGLGGALVLIVGGWSLSGHRGGVAPVIEADSRPLRVKPDNPGGMQVAGANDEILSGDTSGHADTLLPPPETPEPQALKSQAAKTELARAEPGEAGATRAVAAAPAPVQAVPPPAAPVAIAEPKPAVRPEVATKTAASPAHAAGRSTQVQLAALDSEALAMTEWQRLSKRMPDVLGGREPAVVKAERDGRTIWRLRTGGFNDVSQATAFCEKVRAKGTGCSVAAF